MTYAEPRMASGRMPRARSAGRAGAVRSLHAAVWVLHLAEHGGPTPSNVEIGAWLFHASDDDVRSRWAPWVSALADSVAHLASAAHRSGLTRIGPVQRCRHPVGHRPHGSHP